MLDQAIPRALEHRVVLIRMKIAIRYLPDFNFLITVLQINVHFRLVAFLPGVPRNIAAHV
jgi:hypothetical protein